MATAFLEGGVGLLQVEDFRKCLLKEKARAGNVVQLVEGSLACAGWIPRVCRPRIAAHACNPSTLEVLAGEAEVQGRPWYTVSSKLPETLTQTQTDYEKERAVIAVDAGDGVQFPSFYFSCDGNRREAAGPSRIVGAVTGGPCTFTPAGPPPAAPASAPPSLL